MERITDKRWDEAQKAERECHDKFLKSAGFDHVKDHYKATYQKYFKYLDIDPICLDGLTIIEIGCADFPALEYCNVDKGILVEPLPSDILIQMVDYYEHLYLIQSKCEDIELPQADEIWLLNVMQHVQDPDKFIENCKKAAKVIRFFEPIEWPIEIYHPHTFTHAYYLKHFPEAVRYEGTDREFHTARCSYGVHRA